MLADTDSTGVARINGSRFHWRNSLYVFSLTMMGKPIRAQSSHSVTHSTICHREAVCISAPSSPSRLNLGCAVSMDTQFRACAQPDATRGRSCMVCDNDAFGKNKEAIVSRPHGTHASKEKGCHQGKDAGHEAVSREG